MRRHLALPFPALASLLCVPTWGLAPQVETPIPQIDPQAKKKEEKAQPFRDLTPDQALDLAALERKMSIIFCLGPQKESERFEAETLSNAKVQSWLATHTVSTRLRQGNVGEKTWLDRYGINQFPTAILRAPDMRMLDTMVGFQGPDEFLLLLDNMQKAISVTEKPTGKAAQDPYSWLAYGNYMAGRGMHPEETAEALFWCYDEGPKHDPEFLPKNLDFLLRRLTHVSYYSEDVKNGVRARRDALHNRVVAAKATDFDAHMLARFGLWMRDQDDPMRAFRKMPRESAKAKALREVLLWNILERLVAYRHYEDILACIPDPKKAIAARFLSIEVKAQKDQPIQVDADMPRPPGVTQEPEAQEEDQDDPKRLWPKVAPERPMPGVSLDREDACYDASLLYECLLSMGRAQDGLDLMEMATEYMPTSTVYGFFIQRACRIERYDIAEGVAERAYTRVPVEDVPRVQAMLRRGKRSTK